MGNRVEPAMTARAVLPVMGLVVGLGAVGLGAATATGATTGDADWTVYHHDPQGSGVDSSGARFTKVHPRWTSRVLDGDLYGEPLVEGGNVYVATEANTIYALSGATGAVEWSTHLGPPVPSDQLPCGDISPSSGVTGTPVIDPTRREMFVVADEEVSGRPLHMLVGLSLARGRVLLDQAVDPPGASSPALLQRTGLNLSAGRVVFGYGGNYGDCSTYHGWVISVPESGGAIRSFEVDAGRGQSQGAVWMGGAAPEVDATGNVWISVGNGSETGGTYDGSDSVIELSADLQLLQLFAPSDWGTDNANDEDLGSSAPALLGDGLVVQAGKSHTGYLLSRTHLGGIGGQLAQKGAVCGTDVGGGDAVLGNVVYLPCRSGTTAVRVDGAPPSLSILWRTASGAGGPPIVAGGLLWSISQTGELVALDPTTGATTQQLTIGRVANHFPTPSSGDGLLLAASARQVHAFASTVGMPATATSTTGNRPAGPADAAPVGPSSSRAAGQLQWKDGPVDFPTGPGA